MTARGNRPADRTLNRITWGQAIAELVRSHGVQQIDCNPHKEFEDDRPGGYLFRMVDGEDFWFPLPFVFEEGERIGLITLENMCRRLDLNPLEVFREWRMDM